MSLKCEPSSEPLHISAKERGVTLSPLGMVMPLYSRSSSTCFQREFFIDNPLVQIRFIIVMIRWTGLAPWEFEFPFPGSLTPAFLLDFLLLLSAASQRRPIPPRPSPRPSWLGPQLRPEFGAGPTHALTSKPSTLNHISKHLQFIKLVPG